MPPTIVAHKKNLNPHNIWIWIWSSVALLLLKRIVQLNKFESEPFPSEDTLHITMTNHGLAVIEMKFFKDFSLFINSHVNFCIPFLWPALFNGGHNLNKLQSTPPTDSFILTWLLMVLLFLRRFLNTVPMSLTPYCSHALLPGTMSWTNLRLLYVRKLSCRILPFLTQWLLRRFSPYIPM